MKPLFLILSFLFAIVNISNAQGVQDTHPQSSIFAIDYSTGQQTLAGSDAAILFKDALIELVSGTGQSRFQLSRAMPGPKLFIIKQLDPQANGNAFTLTLIYKYSQQPVYTFMYNADQNALSFYNPQSQTYLPVEIVGNNVNNQNLCAQYGTFNAPNAQPAQATAIDADNSAPVDADVTATVAPPAIPDEVQPDCPTDGYLWQPGFWAFSPANGGYYWVPGSWVSPPQIGFLWTPPYWGFDGGIYGFHGGYWGNSIGFYGGINYGYGYAGVGFGGGEWRGGYFAYNTAVVHVNVAVIDRTHVFEDRTKVFTGERNHLAFNGRGGIIAKPNRDELAAAHEHHVMATAEQNRHQQTARSDKGMFASANGGKPSKEAIERVAAKSPAGPAKTRMAGPGGARPGVAGPGYAKTGGVGTPAKTDAVNSTGTKSVETKTTTTNSTAKPGGLAKAPGKPAGKPKVKAAKNKK
jgi:hypothetical protein